MFPVRIYSMFILRHVSMKMSVTAFVHSSKTLRALGKATTRWKLHKYKFGGLQQRIKSGWIKHSVTKTVLNKYIFSLGLGDGKPHS